MFMIFGAMGDRRFLCLSKEAGFKHDEAGFWIAKSYRTLADFLSGDKKSHHLSASVRWIQTSLRQNRGLSGDIWQCLISNRLVGPCRLVCGGPRQLVGARAYLNQWGITMIVTWKSVFANMTEIYSAPSLNAVGRDKESASVRQADGPTNFSPIDPDKRSAVLRQKIGYSAAALRD